MDTDSSITLSALKFVSGESNHVCRLCFSSTENQELSVEDSFNAKSTYIDTTLTIQEMFLELGIPPEPSLPQVICESCTYAAINSYLFKKLCQYSDEKWKEALDVLEKGLSETNTLGPTVQMAFIVLKKDENLICTSRQRNKTKTKSAALLKMKYIMDNKNKYMNKKKKIICEECGVQRTSLRGLMRHMETHSRNKEMDTVTEMHDVNKKRFSCLQCARLFTTKTNLTSHVERVHTAKEFQCSKCAKMFSSQRFLKAHETDYHIAKDCKICSIQFPSKSALRRHMDKHYVDTCLNCEKTFTNRLTYKYHIRICGDPKSKSGNFFCDICGKGYTRKNSLRSHLRTDHGFGRVLTCSWCSKKFDAISKLNNHIVKHTRERNFYCEHCGGKFVTQAALRYHIRLHTGEKPYPCDLCEESFLSSSRRMEHKHRKHFEPTKECAICHSKFTTSSQLKKHFKRHSNPHSKLYVPVFDKKISAITRNDTETTNAIFSLEIQ